MTTAQIKLLDAAVEAFISGGAAPAQIVDEKSFYAKIGELSLENDFLECSLVRPALRA